MWNTQDSPEQRASIPPFQSADAVQRMKLSCSFARDYTLGSKPCASNSNKWGKTQCMEFAHRGIDSRRSSWTRAFGEAWGNLRPMF
jgi:hypothetical protein